jgi:transmembrane E3 ubiquitin-protein ligase
MQGNLIGIVFPYLTFLAYLFWVPQIVRNAQRGTNRPLRWSYILGTSIARLWLVGYFWGGLGPGKENVLFADRSCE